MLYFIGTSQLVNVNTFLINVEQQFGTSFIFVTIILFKVGIIFCNTITDSSLVSLLDPNFTFKIVFSHSYECSIRVTAVLAHLVVWSSKRVPSELNVGVCGQNQRYSHCGRVIDC